MKHFFVFIFSLSLLWGCSNNRSTNEKTIALKPVEPAANILYSFNDFWNYWSDAVKLSERFNALDTDNTIITKKHFLKELISGNYLPLRLQADNNDSNYYKLYKIDASADKNISATIAQMTAIYYHYFQMEGEPLTGFNFVDLNGERYSPETCKGKIVVLNFWFIHCTSCVQEMPQLNRMVDKYKNRKDVIFLSLALDDTNKLKAFLSKTKFDYAVVPAMNKYLTDTLQVEEFPTHIILDRNSKIVYAPENFQELAIELRKVIGSK